MITSNDWDAEEVLKNYMLEKEHDNTDPEEAIEQTFREHAKLAALSVVHIALNSDNEAKRLEASKYVIDRVIGRINDSPFSHRSGEDPLVKILKGALVTN